MGENLRIEKQFGEYTFVICPNHGPGTERLRLFRLDIDLLVEQRSLEVLEQLLAAPYDTLVMEEDIARKLWPARQAINNVEVHVNKLRKAFGDVARKPRFIGTVHRRGYKFLLPYEVNQRTIKSDSSVTTERPEDIEKAFDEFFGTSAKNSQSVIILQSDLIDAVLGDDASPREYARPQKRFYKARSVVNTWDLYGAIAIQDAFQKQRRPVPKLILSDHNIIDTSHNSAALMISMGLGFTDATLKAIDESCGQWMQISWASGEAVSIHMDLLPSKKNTRIKLEIDSDNRGFRRLLPFDWSNKYMESWLQMRLAPNRRAVRDYAMILRHTRVTPFQVLLVVAGFTERSTGIAGKYLENNWKNLWETHVKGRSQQSSLGDFLIIIEGPSDSRNAPSWSEVAEFQVTPQKLRDKQITCEWSNRLTPASPE